MKNLLYIFFLGLFIYSCGSGRDFKGSKDSRTANDTVRIANDSLQYEIIIIEPGFNLFINSLAKPKGYYSQSYLESKNQILVQEYNSRVRNPLRYNPNLYIQEINYDPFVNYGYDVNYLLYNYFVYLSNEYNQRFSVPTRL
ncbi:MAG TPA: DUF6146 family protein [Gillisia sp.]|nr:DUF6146 family protein [Gillisia sp.]